MNVEQQRAARRRLGLPAALLTILATLAPTGAKADKTPAECGLSTIEPYSGVIIKSCLQPSTVRPDDVWVDNDNDLLYVSRGYFALEDPDEQRLWAYDIANPESPAEVPVVLTSNESDPSGAVAAVGVAAGNGMVFTANDCEAVGGCTGEVLMHGWNACSGWSTTTLGTPGGGAPDPVFEMGMHTAFYDAVHGILYGANNIASVPSALEIPYWELSSCPMGVQPDPTGTIDHPILGSVQKIHEVAAANGRLAVAATDHVLLFDVSGGLVDPPYLGWTDAADILGVGHSAWPFAANKIVVTEERTGGRFLGFEQETGNLTLIPKGSHTMPDWKTCSYHEVVYVSGQAYLSAYQGGMQAWRWVPDEGELVLAAYFDTSNSGAADCNLGPREWVGALGIAYAGKDGTNRRLVAVSNVPASEFAPDRKVFLLSVYDPDPATCTGITCTETTPTSAGPGPYPDILVARGTDDGSAFLGKLVRYPVGPSGPATPVTVPQAGLTAGHDYGYDAVVGDFNDDGLDDIAVGAPGQTVGNRSAGVVYIYQRSAGGAYSLVQTLDQASLGANADDERFGAALAAGDFDGDGIDDLAVGAPAATEGTGVAAGAVFLFRGSTSWMVPWTTLTNTSGHEGDRFGHALAAGDFNGKAPIDLAVGAPRARLGQGPHAGFVHGYQGRTNAVPALAVVKQQTGLDANEVGDQFGLALAAGDYNDDGRDDLVVGAPGEHIGTIGSGQLYAFLGSTRSFLLPSDRLDQAGLDANEQEDMFGRRLVAGDFDGDGFDDLAAAAPGEMPGSSPRAGHVYVYQGSASRLVPQTSVDQVGLETNDDMDGFGERVAAADWDGDGKVDLVVVAPGILHGATDNPLFLFSGATGGPTAWQTLTVP